MHVIDWIIIVVYLIGLIGLSRYLSRRQFDVEDYYLGGRRLSWWAVGLSTMATQLSAVSFVSAPAFVALKPGGGLIWLGYEFAVPLAVLFLMIFFLPVYHRTRVMSIYEYLEKRFDAGTRTLVSLVFQISRAMATGVTIFAVSIVISATVGIPLWVTILITGVVTLIYDAWGGMRAVIYSDVLQMIILMVGIVLCGLEAYELVGGWDHVVQSLSPERFRTIDWAGHGFGDGRDFGFWPLAIGGFFLYASYYGCDQSQMQRELSVAHVDDGRRSLMFNGFVRFPIVVGYCFMGLFIGAFALRSREFAAMIPSEHVDYMVPLFVVHYLPAGVTGFILMAILAAAMSSLDSALNSLSAATMSDLYQRYINPRASQREYLLWSKIITVMWGVICVGFAFAVGRISGTVIEIINKVGSLFYGPILATFVLGMLTRTTSGRGVKVGLLVGVGVNFVLWAGFPGISWLWWNAIGCLVTLGVGYGLSRLWPGPRPPASTLWARDERTTGDEALNRASGSEDADARPDSREAAPGQDWRWRYVALGVYFFLIIFIAHLIGPIK